MDVSLQVADLEEDVALLKAEIKPVLRDIRTALLNNDNPFAMNTGAAASSASDEPAASPKLEIPSSPTPAPLTAPQSAPPAAPPGSPQPVPAPSSVPPPGSIEPTTAPGGVPSAPSIEQAEADAGSQKQSGRLHLLTIAGLMAWAEEAVGTPGTERFEIVLELGAATDLISPESRDVLARIAKLVPSNKSMDEPMNVIECLVVLRQLEAILQGENIAKLPLRRSASRDEAA